MQQKEIIEALWRYGHFRNPENSGGSSHAVTEADVTAGTLNLHDDAVMEAIRSYQHFQKPTLDEIATQVHGRRGIADGEVGPATEQLLNLPRCGAPDFVLTEEALGSGRWGQCKVDLYPENHAVTVAWDLSKCPAFLKPVFEQVWKNVVAAYAEVGIALVREDGNANANLQCRFTVPQQEAGNLRGSWIGLAIVGWAGIRCSDEIWALFDLQYNPANTISEWTTLIKHEIGHNMGLQHSSGGVMNPSIVRGLAISWKGDPSWSTLARWFGGEPVVTSEPPVIPVPPGGGGAIPDLEVIYKGRPYTCFPKAQV